MEVKPATLGDFSGEGYATISKDRSGRRSCEGVFYSQSLAAGFRMMTNQAGNSRFTGVVYEGGAEHELSFDVVVTNTVGRSNRGTTITFVASGDPFTG